METNKTQLQTTTATLVGTAAGYAAARGWLGLDATGWTAVILGGIALWPAIVTRAKSLKDTVGSMRGTTVVTDAASAAALPDNRDVVAATPEIVAAIKKAQ